MWIEPAEYVLAGNNLDYPDWIVINNRLRVRVGWSKINQAK